MLIPFRHHATEGEMPADATPMFSNEFGTVYSDRVAFYAKKGWFGGGVLEELPVRHITSIRIETTRKAVLGVILCLVGLAMFSVGNQAIIVGLCLLAIGVLLLLGWPAVTINTAGGDLRRSSGGFWQKGAAEDFVAAVRKALFDKP
jgi:hypothetical protein